MDFAKHINNNEQQLVDGLATIKQNLRSLYDLRGGRFDNTHRFYLEINGMDKISCRIRDGKFRFSVEGLDKFQISYNEKASIANLKENLIPKIDSKIAELSVGRYSQMCLTIVFDELTETVVKDIMLLVNATEAKLKPKNIRNW